MKRITLIIAFILVFTALYPSARVMAQEQRPLIDYVQSLQMAEDILRPEAKQLTITRDPFQPIVTPAPKFTTLPSAAKKPVVVVPEDHLDDVKVIGLVSLGDEYRAYITVGQKSRVVALQDTVRKYTIISIDMDHVVFKSGQKEITKKRG